METEASNKEEIQIDRKLSEIYDEALKLYNEFEGTCSSPMNSIEVQVKIQ